MKTLPTDKAALAATIKDQGDEHIHMPRIPTTYSPDRYHNVHPSELLPEALKGKVVLLDVWDYTCVNCIRTLPYINSWQEKYNNKGLLIVGIHSPEFDFEKDAQHLGDAIKKFGISYPVVADNEFEIWNSLANRYWPAKYLFDKNGILRASHFGEGQYQEFEAFIQKVLLERDSSIAMPDLTDLVHPTDKPGSVCYKPTPETYIGFERNHPANKEEAIVNKPTIFTLPSTLEEDRLYFSGSWIVRRQFAAPSPGTEVASLVISCDAKEANLVIRPQEHGAFKVLAEQDGKPIAKENRGSDIIEEGGMTYVAVDKPRMYRILNNAKFGRSVLRLSSTSPSFGAYAFTFTSDCKE